jgi:hypothetical protein
MRLVQKEFAIAGSRFRILINGDNEEGLTAGALGLWGL